MTLARLATRRVRGIMDRGAEDGEILQVGRPLIESEILVDAIYGIYLDLLSKGWLGGNKATDHGRIDDIGQAYLHGFYVPCVPRLVFTGQVHLACDALPDHAGLVDWDEDDKPLFISARRTAPPRGVAAATRGPVYAVTVFYREDRTLHRDQRRHLGTGDVLHARTRHVQVRERDGWIVPCVSNRDGPPPAGLWTARRAMDTADAAMAINACADGRHLWAVETSEPLVGRGLATPLRLGVAEDHVKSLFYARSLPLTESGRRRPILHCVRAHARRIASGIEVDVRRHLRGIETFDMGGFPFTITQPTKAQPIAPCT